MSLQVPRNGEYGGRLIHWRGQPGSGEAAGEPPVVFINGCAMSAHHWLPVVHQLPERELICFDRPGMAGTPWPGDSPTLDAEVGTLADLVEREFGRPAVLVAHSMGAFHAEALARLRPELVRGLVMVDPSVVWEEKDPGPGAVAPARVVHRLATTPPLAWTGDVAHRIGEWAQSHHYRTRSFKERFRKRLKHMYRSPDSLAMGVAEYFAFDAQAWDLQLLRSQTTMPQVTGEILTAGMGHELPHEHQQLGKLLGLSCAQVEHSRHLMMVDRPDAIVAAIERA